MQSLDTPILVRTVIDVLGPEVMRVFGDPDAQVIDNLKPSNQANTRTLDWIHISRTDKQRLAEETQARVIIVDPDVAYSAAMQAAQKVLIIHGNPKLAILRIGQAFFVHAPKPGIHPTANIHPALALDASNYVGENVSIGDCTLGKQVSIYPNVVIHDGVIIKDNVVIKSGAVLGGSGFGWERDTTGNWIRFPQVGGVIVHEGVEIGANTCVDRGALSDTIIGFNTKINNLCHIAHNVVIGRNVIVAAQVNISGSTVIEDDVWVGPHATFRGHQRIGRCAVVGMGAVVTKDIPAGETWFGNPARKYVK
jgi:UDP-3-O-[3-hydroxymyristoyl] glucosamine N-acyltransferase